MARLQCRAYDLVHNNPNQNVNDATLIQKARLAQGVESALEEIHKLNDKQEKDEEN